MSTTLEVRDSRDRNPAGDVANSHPTNQPEESDLQKYLRTSVRQVFANAAGRPPSANPNDTSSTNVDGDENRSCSLGRANSVYSFSRNSFSSQLAQLTSIKLPEPSVLQGTIEGITSASNAFKTLGSYSEQMQQWIEKASDVLAGLDAEDDVEWAAAGGRQGLDDVDKAVIKFESLVEIYVKAVERVPFRDDIKEAGPEALSSLVMQMDDVLKKWNEVKTQLKDVKEQVELAMEWEKLWSAVLGDVSMEIDDLSKLIFEMEEKRHKTMLTDFETDASHGLDINELETIVEDSPSTARMPSNNRLSLAPALNSLPATSPAELSQAKATQDETSMMALFARMQPLRASLDFLPMHLSAFLMRARHVFPSACDEVEDRRRHLEKRYEKLQKDAQILRSELSEDKWIIVFRNAGRQANKMCDSVERSIYKLQEAIETDGGLNVTLATISNKVENFEAKRVHYGPAIGRVLGIMEKGINDRLTVNGEIIRLYADLKERNDSLNEKMKAMEFFLTQLREGRGPRLRDSLSSILTPDSPHTVSTPDSSPASSVVLSVGRGTVVSRRESSTSSTARTPMRRMSAAPSSGAAMATTPKSVRRQSAIPRAAGTPGGHLAAPSSSRHTAVSPTPRSGSSMSQSTTPGLYSHHPSQQPSKPRWNTSSNTNDLNVGHNFKPLSLTNPSPYRREAVPVRTRPPSTVALNYPGASSSSAVRNRSVPPPIPTPHRQKPSAPPSSSVPAPPTPSRSSRAASSLGFRTASRLTSRFRSSSPLPPEQEPSIPSTSRFKGGAGSRMSMMGPPRGQHGNGSVLDPPPYSKLQKPNSNSALSDGSSGGSDGVPPVPRTSRSSIFSSSHSRCGGGSSSKKATSHDDGHEDHAGRGKAPARPDTSLGHHSGSSKRISLLPLPRHKSAGKINADAGKTPARPPWR